MVLRVPKYFTADSFKITGIYFLLHNGKVVYVGKTVNLINRIGQHPNKKFDTIRVIQCTKDDLDMYERRLIKILKPKYNLMQYEPIKGDKRSIRIPRDVDKQLQKRAKSQGRSINSQIIYELSQK